MHHWSFSYLSRWIEVCFSKFATFLLCLVYIWLEIISVFYNLLYLLCLQDNLKTTYCTTSNSFFTQKWKNLTLSHSLKTTPGCSLVTWPSLSSCFENSALHTKHFSSVFTRTDLRFLRHILRSCLSRHDSALKTWWQREHGHNGIFLPSNRLTLKYKRNVRWNHIKRWRKTSIF